MVEFRERLLEADFAGADYYRPLHGTLFRAPLRYISKLESTYKASIEDCVPKMWTFVPDLGAHCYEIKVSCSVLDDKYPRIKVFPNPEGPGSIEVGVKKIGGKCFLNTVFISSVPHSKFL